MRLDRLIAALGPAVLLLLGCGDETDNGVGTGSTSVDESSGTTSSGDGTSTTGGGSDTGSSSTTSSHDTGTTSAGCEPIQLAEIAGGIGGFAMDGEAEQDLSGLAVSRADDVNGDGLADLLVAAPNASANAIHWAGRAYVVFGKADTASVSLDNVTQEIGGFALDGEAEDDRSGHAVSGAGDVNGDGLADVVLGGPYTDANGHWSGRAYVVFGKEDTDKVSLADVAQGIGGFVLDGEGEYSHAGWSVSGVGDMNGDGLADVVVGTLCGRVYVVFGKADSAGMSLADVAAGTGGFSLDGGYASCVLGRSVSGAGDVNGDGCGDLLVGAFRADPGGAEWSGRTYVVFGRTDMSGVMLHEVAQGSGGFALDGEMEGDQSGWSVSGAGDVNGDGLDDVLVGAYLASPNGLEESGRTYVVFGKTDTEEVSLGSVAQGAGGFVLDGEVEGDRSGRSISAAGDVNDDGFADLVVGAQLADPNGTSAGRTYVVFGKQDTEAIMLGDITSGTGGFALDGEHEYDWAGYSVSGAGDVNGDGLADVVLGAAGADPTGDLSGRTYVVFGKTDTERVQLADVVLGSGGFAMDGEGSEDRSGQVVSGAGDVNGDDLGDVILGAFSRTYVVFGKTGTQAVSLANVALGNGGFVLENESRASDSFDGAGDINGDGFDDVIVGVYDAYPSGTDSGRTYVVLGKADSLAVALADVAQGIGGFVLDGEAEGDESGRSVSGAGDVNADGILDLIVGAPWVDPSGVERAGRSYVFLGGDFSCEAR